MENDKIILVSNNDFVVIQSENSKDVISVQIYDNSLNFILYEDMPAERVAFNKGYSVENTKKIRIVEFEDEIYLRAKRDTEAVAPICIEEDGDTLNIVDMYETDCINTIEDMKGNIDEVSENFEIVEGRPFLMEDEFSV
jgi:hypothetical protein